MKKRYRRIEEVRKVLEDFYPREVDGVKIDIDTAREIIQTFELLRDDPEKQKEFATLPIPWMAQVAHKTVSISPRTRISRGRGGWIKGEIGL